ncbi:hypothetical protein QKW35_13550 [Pontibacterium granulatum]|uniref:hypothetical protein n=1 Tax=Pontibacterium granulatum TaxID=2036029 RepID=UPI00249A374E|nr:hypothetical protein [Pontibacterium granulatum]MDI3325402.1 hypothetical protein [Pontibacterium granulatum]
MATYLICNGATEYFDKGNTRFKCTEALELYNESELVAILEARGVISDSPQAGLDPASLDRLAAAIEQFNQLMETLFVFDPELFGIVLLGCLMLFSKGWGLGVIVRRMSARQ